MTDEDPQAQACTEPYRKKRLLWSSDRDAGATSDYYADTLTLIQIDDGLWKLRLNVGGHVVDMRIKNIEKYV